MTIAKNTQTFIILAVLSSAALISSAHAYSGKDARYEVQYSLADLESNETAKRLLHRIHNTANDLCWDELGPERYVKKLDVQRCLADVTEDLVNQVGHVKLNIAHAKQSAPRKLVRKGKSTRQAKMARPRP